MSRTLGKLLYDPQTGKLMRDEDTGKLAYKWLRAVVSPSGTALLQANWSTNTPVSLWAGWTFSHRILFEAQINTETFAAGSRPITGYVGGLPVYGTLDPFILEESILPGGYDYSVIIVKKNGIGLIIDSEFTASGNSVTILVDSNPGDIIEASYIPDGTVPTIEKSQTGGYNLPIVPAPTLTRDAADGETLYFTWGYDYDAMPQVGGGYGHLTTGHIPLGSFSMTFICDKGKLTEETFVIPFDEEIYYSWSE
jgi:hypothetical protein